MDSKAWYKSTTIQGAIVAIISNILLLSPIEMSNAELAQVSNVVTGIANAVGFVMIIIGRVKAQTKIGG